MKVRLWVRAVLALSNLYRRLLGVFFVIVGPRVAYQLTGFLARILYRLLAPFRQLSEAQCRAAMSDFLLAEEIPKVAEQAFVHRIWSLVDLPLAGRYLHPGTYARFGGQIPDPDKQLMLAAQHHRQPIILVTAYFGPFDLLPVFMGLNGIKASVVYRPHGNAAFDRYRYRIRAKSGCDLVPVDQATERLSHVLAAGGTIAIVADHHQSRGGIPATFLGLPTRVSKSVGLLARQYNATVIVAGIRRINSAFQFAIELTDTIKPIDWRERPGAIEYITSRYLRALEVLIRQDPTQYFWGYARWGRDTAERFMEAAQSTPTG